MKYLNDFILKKNPNKSLIEYDFEEFLFHINRHFARDFKKVNITFQEICLLYENGQE